MELRQSQVRCQVGHGGTRKHFVLKTHLALELASSRLDPLPAWLHLEWHGSGPLRHVMVDWTSCHEIELHHVQV